jgi:hypothetical protein
MDAWYAQLSERQKSALSQYKMSSENIRLYLSGHRSFHLQTGEEEPSEELIAALDSAIQGYKLSSDTTVYCGVERGQNVRSCITGKRYQHQGYISTAPDPEIAVGSFIKRFDLDPILLKFSLPAGFACAPFDPFKEFAGERELLLGREVSFEVADQQSSNAAVWDPIYGNAADTLTVVSLRPSC